MPFARRSVAVRVPASTSNLGSGYDTLGLALKLYNIVRVTRCSAKRMQIVSPVADKDRAAAIATVGAAARLFFRRTGKKSFGLEVSVAGDVPVARGLGYSATVRIGILAALNTFTRAGLDRRQLLDLAVELEGHPDNASPSIFGGFTVSGMVGSTVRCLRFPVSPQAKFVTLIPRFKISTRRARALMPKGYSRADAAHALNRAALITAAFASGDWEALRGVFDDRFHQPYRERLIPELSRVIGAGERAGAMGGFLSGSGSAIICLTRARPEAVAKAMRKQLPDSEVVVLSPDNDGLQL